MWIHLPVWGFRCGCTLRCLICLCCVWFLRAQRWWNFSIRTVNRDFISELLGSRFHLEFSTSPGLFGGISLFYCSGETSGKKRLWQTYIMAVCLLLILGRYKMSTEFRLLKLHHIHPSRRVNKFIKGNQNPRWCHRTGIILRMLLECLIPALSRSDESPWSTARLPLPEPATSD